MLGAVPGSIASRPSLRFCVFGDSHVAHRGDRAGKGDDRDSCCLARLCAGLVDISTKQASTKPPPPGSMLVRFPSAHATPYVQVVLSNFGNSGEQMSLTAALFQGLFPPINVQKTSLAACKVQNREVEEGWTRCSRLQGRAEQMPQCVFCRLSLPA